MEHYNEFRLNRVNSYGFDRLRVRLSSYGVNPKAFRQEGQ